MFLFIVFVMPAGPAPRLAMPVDRTWAIMAACIALLLGAWNGWSEWKRSEERLREKPEGDATREV